MNARYLLLLILGIVIISGCSNVSQNVEERLIACDAYKNADFCIEVYEPVCAKLESLEAPYKVEWRTFSNACKACTFSFKTMRVVGYIEGECPQANCAEEGVWIPEGENITCCSGLKQIPCVKPNEKGECMECGGFYCAKCGDGVCGPGENKCNCVDCQ